MTVFAFIQGTSPKLVFITFIRFLSIICKNKLDKKKDKNFNNGIDLVH